MRILTATGRCVLATGVFCGLLIGALLVIHWPVEPEPSYTIKLITVRAYCPCEICCREWADGHTANGWEIKPGDKFVAANPDLLPLGTMVTVPGYNNNQSVPVLDRSGGGVEVFFHTHEEAEKWGVQRLKVKIERRKL